MDIEVPKVKKEDKDLQDIKVELEDKVLGACWYRSHISGDAKASCQKISVHLPNFPAGYMKTPCNGNARPFKCPWSSIFIVI